MKLLKELYEIHSPSKGEFEMQKFIANYLTNIGGVVWELDETGNIYATKGESETYPCVVAHMDEVHHKRALGYRVLECDGVICGFDMLEKKSQGVGADDKNGIWVCLKCLEKYDVMKCAFFVGEEIGCVGSSSANMDFFNDCRYVLQCDRRSNADFITNAAGTELCTDDFVRDCNIGAYGYKETNGSVTDVMELKERGLKVCAANISCGYYNPHTDSEVTVFADLQNCLALVCNIIETCVAVYPHEYVNKWDYYDDWYGYGGYKRGGDSDWDAECLEAMKEDARFYKNYLEFEEEMQFIYGASVEMIHTAWQEAKQPKSKKKRRKIKRTA